MSTAAAESAGSRQALAFHRDGLLDIFLGLTLLDAWTLLRDPPGTGSGGAVVMLFPLLLVAKRAITVPRLPHNSPGPPRSTTCSWPHILAGAAAVLLASLGASALPGSPVPGPLLSLPWGPVSLLGLAIVAAAGVCLRAWRFVLYAGLASFTLGLTFAGHGTLKVYFTPALAGLMIVWGGALLVRFLALHPRPDLHPSR